MISKKTKVETVRAKLMRVLKRRKTAIGTKELAMKAGVNYNSAKDELRRMEARSLVFADSDPMRRHARALVWQRFSF